MTIPQPAVAIPTPVLDEPIYHAEPSESVGACGRWDDFQEQFDEMQREIKALCGKDLFGKNAHDLCLVPNVQIPAKFKVPDFEKYKGNSCPQSHLVMYARKMSTQTDNHELLIHYFQDSLTGAALKWYMGLDSSSIRTFNDLGEAFIRQYKYNLDMAPDRDQLRAMTQKDKETFKEYAQRWREIAAQINPPLEEKEMTKIFLKTLGSFYYERMIASAPSDFTEMVNMGMRLEEGVREGRLAKDGGLSGGAKKFGNNFSKKKEQEVGMVTQGRPRRNNYQQNPQHIAAVVPAPDAFQNPRPQLQFQQRPPQQYQQQPRQQFNDQNRTPRTPQFDPIPMTYAELLPALIEKNLVQTRTPPPVPEKLPWWYRADRSCAFHQGAPGHDIEQCFALKHEVQKLIRANTLSFKDTNPNVQANPLPNHGSASVNMVQACPGKFRVFDIRLIQEPLVQMHINLCKLFFFQHNHAACLVCPNNPRGCLKVRRDIQGMLDRRELQITYKRNEDEEDVAVITPEFNIPKKVEIAFDSQKLATAPLVICLPGPLPYASSKVVPYKYHATMIENGQEIPMPTLPTSINIAEVSRVTRSGRVFPAVSQKKNDASTSQPVPVEPLILSPSSGRANETISSDFDEVLKLIKKSEYKVVDQLLQTPSKISILSLLLNSEVHRDALMKVLDQAFVDQDVTVDQFGGIVGNIMISSNLSFNDEELPEEGTKHNLGLYISMNCQSDALSNVLVDNGSALNVMPKATLDQLSYQGNPMRHSGVTVRAFDGSRRSVMGKVDLPMTIGPQVFQITFQVMDIQAAFSCLLGRPWIHEAEAVPFTRKGPNTSCSR
ncbi:unnamed protein product [Trifolium pratense]|uniref:Uncharacterized protein n=1 Tax=Trifolium pratense TaxID=57577 RepID=A0ACB0LYL6_TRIPR|nr:unnamed protein product [Trifolium pratense]